MSASLARRLLEEFDLIEARNACQDDPKALISQIKFFDPSQADSEHPTWVEFLMYPPEGWEPPIRELPNDEWRFDETKGANDWYWQSCFIEWLHDPKNKKLLVLKARQLGITLLACSYALWLMLFRPGSVCVAYSYTEEEAKKLAVAVWAMYNSLPEIFRAHVTVISPQKAEEPSEWIKLKHKDGRVSSFQALPATPKHGHGARVTFAIMDEVAYMDHARRIYTAINPATTRGKAKLLMISTAFGVSNAETGEGNYFHHLYATRKEKKLAYRFLPWNLEPTRDEQWYADEAMKLDEVERNQQYPLTENDAFMLSGHLFFDRAALDFYRHETIEPIMVGQFAGAGRRKAEFMQFEHGTIEVYVRPKIGHEYAIGIDGATGKGADYTFATVLDLTTGEVCATFRAKMEAPRAAFQVHYLGKWYNRAKIAVERQGGYGEAIIFALRDGNKNLPAYGNLYQDKAWVSQSKSISDQYGIPMGPQRRWSVLDMLKSYLRSRLYPYMPTVITGELGTFVYADTNPSPRAQDGCNDDGVLSLGIASWVFNEYGDRAEKPRKRNTKKRQYQPPPTRS